MESSWLSWNLRGLGKAEKRREVKEALRKSHPELVLLQETKLVAQKGKIAKALSLESTMVPAVGSAGGLMTLWKPYAFSLIRIQSGERYVIIVVKDNNLNMNMVIGNIYGPNTEGERELMFTKIGTFLSNWEGGCVLVGLQCHSKCRGHKWMVGWN